MGEEADIYRAREEAERVAAATSSLANVRTRSLRAAERWSELAKRAERVKANVASRAADREGA
jgi:hypothetical protein